MKEKDFVEERRIKLLEYINKNGRADVAQLAEQFDVTTATVRRDLLIMEEQNLIYRTHGGAIKRDQPSLWETTTLHERATQHIEEKERIADLVEQLVHDGDSVMIDGGSTTLCVAKKLMSKKKMLIVTNNSTIGEILVGVNENKVILTGGELIMGTNSTNGIAAEQTIKQYRVDQAIIGISGLLIDEGFFTASPAEAEVKRLMLMSAKEKIIVADSSKVGTPALCFVCDFSGIDKLVTDKNISKVALDQLRKAGVEVFTM
jgi:DeoR family transcriptional regulator of aga operon/DeoR family fructose operon transcriptional repressor